MPRDLTDPSGPGFVLFPGPVRSRRDGGVYWFSGERLIQCYGLPRSRCVVAVLGESNERLMHGRIALGPRVAGDYAAHLERRLVSYPTRARRRAGYRAS